MTIDLKKHELYEICKCAYYNISHSPEKRAEAEIRYYEGQLFEFKELCAGDRTRFEDIAAKFKTKFLAYMQAKSRCISSMITGPANFPVKRAEKATASSEKRGQEVYDFVERVRKNFDKEQNPHKYGISSDHVDALDLLKKKLEGLKKNHQLMKDINKICRDKKLSFDEKKLKIQEDTELTEEQAIEVLTPNYMGRIGFARYQLTKNNATIKNTESRIKELEAKQGQETIEQTIKGVRVVQNVEANRIQLFFDGKPKPNTISLLKKRGFRWSPSNSCWQRMLNANGRFATKHFFSEYEA